MREDFAKYDRQLSLENFGEAAQAKLKQARIVLVGAGGVGAGALPLLAGAGLGNILIVDCDKVSASNLHRQTIYKESDIGKSKAELAAEFARNLNTETNADFIELRIENAEQLCPLLRNTDLCIDATDSFHARFAVSEACENAGVNLISASAQNWVSQVACFGAAFWIRNIVFDTYAAAEKSKSLPIFGPSASLAGTFASGIALRSLAGLEEFEPGKFLRFSFESGNFLNTRLNTL